MRNDLKSVPKVPDMVASRTAAIPVKVRPLHGQVVAVGPGRRDDNGRIAPMGVEKGDRILFGKYSGSDVEINGEEHLILQETDILGVIAQ